MKIRKATLKDLKKIEEIYIKGVIDEVKLQFPKKSTKDILNNFNKWKTSRLKDDKRAIRSKNDLILVAEIDKKVIGFGEVKIIGDKKAEIKRIYIERGERNKGIGNELMKKLLDWLKNKKIKSVSAGIFISNKISRVLSKKFGFKETAIRVQKELMKK